MTQPTHLRSLQALELAVRNGSLKAAAEELKITPAAVGQRIKLLEDYLGVDLLARGRSGIRPARALQAAMPHLSAAFRELDTASELLDFQRVHELHIVADFDWAGLWLLPRLSKFKDTYPNTLFCINGVGDVPMRIGQADCQVWFGASRGAPGECTLFHDYLAPVSSPENTSRISALPREECLEGFPLLHLECYHADPDSIGWPEWIRRHGARRTAPGRGIRYRTIVNALEAVYSNAGLMVCGLALVEESCTRGKLSLPFPVSQGAWLRYPYRANFPETALRRTRTVQFRDWLKVEAAATEQRLKSLVLAG